MPVLAARTECPIESVTARAFTIPTQTPESDGTLEWNHTTLVVAEVAAGGALGIGYTYCDAGACSLITGAIARTLRGRDALQSAACYAAIVASIRNEGRTGIAAMAVSAVDLALWDLKGKLLQAPVCALLGAARKSVPVYGSGGFTSYDVRELQEHMAHWVTDGIGRVKMKIGREPERDPERIRSVRKAIGSEAELFVDANGAYVSKQALAIAQRFEAERVSWFEEPVYHRDLRGNAFVRARLSGGVEVSNGEYGYAPDEFAQIVDAGAADVLQADVTRCGGVSGFLAVDALCLTRFVPLSSHCAPAATLHAALAAKCMRHVEYFFDHVRIERMLFDGAPEPVDGAIAADLTRPGIGIELRRADAERFAV